MPDSDRLRRQIAARGRAEGTDADSLLGAIGLDCAAGLRFLPPDAQPAPVGALDAVPVSGRRVASGSISPRPCKLCLHP
jgi:hypothetical protein